MMKKRFAVVTSVAVMFAVAGSAQALLFEDFDSYSSTADMSPPWTQLFAVPMELDTPQSFSPPNSVTAGANSGNSEARMYQSFAPHLPTDADPLILCFMMKENDSVDWWSRQYIEVRAYEGDAFGVGGLQQLIAFGTTSSGVADTSKYSARVAFGSTGWQSSTANRVPSGTWAEMMVVVLGTSVEFYVDGVLAHTAPHAGGVAYDSIVVGSGLSSRVQVWFDDAYVTPEPTSIMLLGIGGLFLWRRRRVA